MKRLFLSISFVLTALAVAAIPAKHGLWQTLTLADGTEVRAQLVGDEHLHFWQAEDGRRYVINDDGTARTADTDQMRARARARRSSNTAASRMRAPRKVSIGERTNYTGKKKGIVILMQFTDMKFKAANNREKYYDILNKENYSEGSFRGSVADYFKAQSNGLFELQFDVVGPYTAKNKYSYYGANDSEGNDMRPDELIVEAVKAADSEVNFSDYDWDGDGEADQVFVVYAGKGEATSGQENTIWPHMYWLAYTNRTVTLDGTKIDTYACSNELTSGGSIDGIGCFCHEFSHCLGYPDFYDVTYQGWFGMGQLDLMDQGSYNGNSFCPAGYTAYEKWMAGWLEPTVLADEDVNVDNLLATSENGKAYIMYNDAHEDEFYIIENRQKTNWDSNLPAKGLMITHVDFDKEIWEQNTPNSKVTQADVLSSYGDLTKANNHQRCTIFHADNDDDSKYWDSYGLYFTKQTLSTDLYPYRSNDSLTATSSPAAKLYNKNKLGKTVMQGAILNIKQNSDKTMSFFYRAKQTTPTAPDDPVADPDKPLPAKGDTLFYESFDKCASVGGNDGKWDTTIAGSSSKFVTDNDGWDYLAAYAGYQCARFGNSSKLGEATTPLFAIDGEATLLFKAAEWNKDGELLKISVSSDTPDNNVTIEPSTVAMSSFEWNYYELKLNGKGNIRLTFQPVKRFLLDDVLVLKTSETTIVTAVSAAGRHEPAAIYTIDGRRASDSFDSLPHGIYIIDGKKVVK